MINRTIFISIALGLSSLFSYSQTGKILLEDINKLKDAEKQQKIENALKDVTVLFSNEGVKVVGPGGKVMDEQAFNMKLVYFATSATVFGRDARISFVSTSEGDFMIEIGNDGKIMSDWILLDDGGATLGYHTFGKDDFSIGISPSGNFLVVPVVLGKSNGVTRKASAQLKVYDEKLGFVKSVPIDKYIQLSGPWGCDISDQGAIVMSWSEGLLYLDGSDWKELKTRDLGWEKTFTEMGLNPVSWGLNGRGEFSTVFLGKAEVKDQMKFFKATWSPVTGKSTLGDVSTSENDINRSFRIEDTFVTPYHYSNVAGYDFFAQQCVDGTIILGTIKDGDLMWSKVERLRADLSPDDTKLSVFSLEDQMVAMVGSDLKLKESEDQNNYTLFVLFNPNRDGQVSMEKVSHSSKVHKTCDRVVFKPVNRSVVRVKSICPNSETEVLIRIN